jgi:phage tail P2-like protein
MTGWFVRLPSSATTLQGALAGVDTARLAALPVPIDTLWNPWRCPSALLPYLAWALSVDIWDDDWSEDRKRKVIAAAPMVHRLKGTRGAVRRALDAFDLESRIVEWWEDGSRHGTFRVEMIYRDGSPEFDPQIRDYAIQAVIASKPKSRVLTARSVIHAGATAYVGVLPRTSMTAVARPFKLEPPTAEAGSYVAVLSATFVTATARFAAPAEENEELATTHVGVISAAFVTSTAKPAETP